MPNATVHVLPGRSGLQVDAIMDIARGLAGLEPRRPSSSVLATVLFTDIVDSTKKQAELGDRKWAELLLAHHTAVRDALPNGGEPSTTPPATGSLRVSWGRHSHPLCA